MRVAVGNDTARAIVFSARDRDGSCYRDSAWNMAWIGNDPGSRRMECSTSTRTLYSYATQGVSPAMSIKMVGIGSKYVWADPVDMAAEAMRQDHVPCRCTLTGMASLYLLERREPFEGLLHPSMRSRH